MGVDNIAVTRIIMGRIWEGLWLMRGNYKIKII